MSSIALFRSGIVALLCYRIFPALVLACLPLSAATIAARTGGTLSTVFVNDPEGISWTAPGSYTDVAISAFLSSASANNNGTGTVYLTNRIGPGTTTANQIAVTTLSGIAFEPSTATNLFSGLSLGPGTYYLITARNLGPGGLGWEAFFGNSATMDPGVIINPEELSLSEASYPPASNFFTAGDTAFNFDVTGNPVLPSVPEPSTLPLAGCGLLLGSLAIMGRRRPERARRS